MDTNEDTCDGELLFSKHHHHHHHHNNNNNNHHHNNNNRSTKESTADNSSSSDSDSDSSNDSIDSTEPANRSPVKPLIEPHVQPVRLIDPLFSLLLLLLHLLWWTALTGGRLLRYAYHLALSRWEAAHLEASLLRLPNIPRNVALGINTPTLEVERLVQLIGWCRRVPTITTVTVYHPYSMEGEEEEEGESDEGGGDRNSSPSFSKLRDRLQKQLAIATTISNHDDPQKKDFKVAFLPFTAGRQSLVEAARYLITTTTKEGDKEGDQQTITPEAISQYLTTHHYPHPDPELLLLFGDCRIYHGFPCWQIRLTETVFLPPLRWLTLSQFHQALKVFSKCEQRFGF